MKDPVRLLDGEASEVERALLLAGAAEEPPPDGAQRLAAALGLSGALLSAPKAAASTTAAHSGARAGTSTAPAAAAGATVAPFAARFALKWLTLAGGGAAIAAAVLVMRGGGGVDVQRGRTQREQPTLREPSPAPVTAPAQGAPAAVADAEAREAQAAPKAEPGRARSRSIAREIEQLDDARSRLQRGQARAALAVLDAYRREHVRGVLGQEAELLRIEALSRAGERAAARQKAERFLRDNPRSPHEDRIRALVGDIDAR